MKRVRWPAMAMFLVEQAAAIRSTCEV